MTVKEEFITINKYSRPGRMLKHVAAVVMHSSDNPGQSAMGVRNYYEMRKSGDFGYGSAHFIININGEIIQDIPENEVAYHCGASEYTEFSKMLFGNIATSERSSPNNYSIGIEMCHPFSDGRPSVETFESAVSLVANLCSRYHLNPLSQITTHKNVMGKHCPRYWVDNPSEFQRFQWKVEKML